MLRKAEKNDFIKTVVGFYANIVAKMLNSLYNTQTRETITIKHVHKTVLHNI